MMSQNEVDLYEGGLSSTFIRAVKGVLLWFARLGQQAVFANGIVMVAAAAYTLADGWRARNQSTGQLGEFKAGADAALLALATLMGLGALTAYLLDRLTDPPPMQTLRGRWYTAQRRGLMMAVGVACLGQVVAAFLVPWWMGDRAFGRGLLAIWHVGVLVVIAACLSAGYALPCVPNRWLSGWLFSRLGGQFVKANEAGEGNGGGRGGSGGSGGGGWCRLRDLPYLKAVWVTMAWVLGTSVAPALLMQAEFETVIRLAVERFGFVAVAVIAFDVRDLPRDKREGIQTIPMRLGIRGTRLLCWALLLLTCVVVLPNALVAERLALFVPAVMLGLLLMGLSVKRSAEYYSVGVDGLVAVQAVALAWAAW